MNHIRTSHARNCPNGSFSDAVLMMSPDPTERQLQTHVRAVVSEGLGAEDAVISVISLDSKANVSSLSFEEQLAADGVSGVNGTLGTVKDPTGGVVNIDCTPNDSMTG